VTGPPVPGTAARGALQAALAAEHAVIYGYGVAGAHLTGKHQQYAERNWTAHQATSDELVSMLVSLGARPVAALDAYRLPFPVRTPAAAVSLAAFLEDRVTLAYLGVVALDDPRLRMWGARQVLASALRATAWTGSTAAFPGLPARARATASARRRAAP
jgi:Domain of unknown function (DUF4439)